MEISAAVIQHLRLHSSSVSHPTPIAHFFCTRDTAEPERRDPREVLLSLIKQLSLTRDEDLIRRALVEEYQKRRQEASHVGEYPTSLTLEECVELICELGRTTPVTLVIDALDECNSQQRAVLLEALGDVRQKCRDVIKIFVSSRYEEDIAAHFGKGEILSVTAKSNEEDLKHFVGTQVGSFVKRWSTIHDETAGTLQQLESEINDTLVAGAQGM
jgi:hypothetical protein